MRLILYLWICVTVIVIRYGCLCHRHFFPVLLLNQQWSPPLTLQASHCSTFRIVCDVPVIAVFFNESIECLPTSVSKFFFKLLVTIPVAPVIIGIIYISGSTLVVSLYINSCILTSFPLPFAQHFCLRVFSLVSVRKFSLFCFELLYLAYLL